MSTYSEDINCPICNSPDCFRECRWRTGEEYISCPNCGYRYIFNWKRDENNEFILKDKTKEICVENLIPEITEVKNPFGSYIIENSKGGSVFGSLKDQEDYNKFRKYIEEVRLESDISEVTVRRYAEGGFILMKLKHGPLAENDDLWEYSEECRTPNFTSCSYCENKQRESDVWYNEICPECFEKGSDQSELECIEDDIEYYLLVNQLN